MHNRMAQALTPDGVAQILRSSSNAGASHIAGDIAQSFIDQGTGRLADELRGNFFRSINLNWRPGYGGREDLVQIDTVMSLLDGNGTSLFGQAGLQTSDGEGGLHVGVGYRAQPAEAVLLGVNAFYDYLSNPEVSRYSIGLEARSPFMDLSGNWYQGLSDETLSDGRIAYSPDGFDVEFSGRLPHVPYLELTGRYYRWDGEGSDPADLQGAEYGLRFFPVPLFTLEGVYDKLSGGGDDVGVEALIHYEFGVPLSEQLQPERVTFQDDVWQRRFERVQRQYEQRVRYRGASSAPAPDLQFGTATATGVPLLFRVPADAVTIRIGWALTSAPSIALTGSPVDLQRNQLTAASGGRHSYDVTIANFDRNTSYRFTVSFRDADGDTVAPALTGDGPGSVVSTTTMNDGLMLRWLRPSGARSARISWAQANSLSQSGVQSADGAAVPLVENGDVTLNLTDTLCPPSGATALCAHTITDLQAGTQYAVTLQLYSSANAGGTPLNSSNVTLMTSGTRATSVLSVTATPGTISEGGAAATITLSASPAPNVRAGLMVPYTITGTGITSADYTLTDAAGNAVTSPVTIPIGETSVALTLTALTDTALAEDAEMLTWRLSAPQPNAGYTLASEPNERVTVTITDDAAPPVVSFAAGTVSTAEAAGTVAVTVQLSRSPDGELTIPVMTANGTATAPGDYTALTQNVVFAANASGAALMQTVSIAITGDDRDEVDETFTVAFGTLPAGAVTAGTPATVTVTITDDDSPAVSFMTGTLSVDESAGTVDVIVQLSASPSTQITIPVMTANGTATAPGDYTALTQNVVFAANASGAGLMQTVSITVADDNLDELDETFTVAFGALPGGVSAGTPATVTVTITDDDVPAVSFAAATAGAGESDGTVEVTVQLSTSPATVITIPVMTADGTGSAAATAGEDYTALTTDVVFAAGTATLTQTVNITITDDDRGEPAQTFTVAFGTLPADVVTAGTPAAVTVTITDDDIPTVSFTTATASVSEDAGPVAVMVQLSASPADDITIPVMTTNGSAIAGARADYTALTQNVVFAASASGAALTQMVSVTVLNDNLVEPDEMFTVAFGTLPSGVVPGARPTVTVTIVNDDTTSVGLGNANRSVDEGEEITLGVGLTTLSALDITIRIVYTDGTAEAGTHYTPAATSVTIAAGEGGVEWTLSTIEDDVDNTDRTFTVSIDTSTLPAGVMAVNATQTITIVDDDVPAMTVSFTTATVSFSENSSGLVPLVVMVQLSTSPADDITIPVMTMDGTAIAGASADYRALTENVVFAGGASGAALTQMVSIAVLNDDLVELDETFTVAFGTLPSGWEAGAHPTVTVTIVNDDTASVGVGSANRSVDEGDEITLAVGTTRLSAVDLTISIMYTDGTAEAGTHYTPAATSVTILAGDRDVQWTLSTIEDDVDNTDRTFMVSIDTSALPAGVIAAAHTTQTITIVDDD